MSYSLTFRSTLKEEKIEDSIKSFVSFLKKITCKEENCRCNEICSPYAHCHKEFKISGCKFFFGKEKQYILALNEYRFYHPEGNNRNNKICDDCKAEVEYLCTNYCVESFIFPNQICIQDIYKCNNLEHFGCSEMFTVIW